MLSAVAGSGVLLISVAVLRMLPRVDRSRSNPTSGTTPASRVTHHQELPYHSTVETEQWKELRGGDVRIEQTIYVERESQRKIVLGKGGQTIKAIGEAARKEIAEVAEAKVHLFLFVKVREGWGEDPERYRAMGLDFPKE